MWKGNPDRLVRHCPYCGSEYLRVPTKKHPHKCYRCGMVFIVSYSRQSKPGKSRWEQNRDSDLDSAGLPIISVDLTDLGMRICEVCKRPIADARCFANRDGGYLHIACNEEQASKGLLRRGTLMENAAAEKRVI
jgi:hypothetical protein